MNIVRTRPPDATQKMFRAFANGTRLRILHILRDGELCVSDIVRILQVPQAKASRHLIYLRSAGLLEARKQGLWIFYKLRAPQSTFHHRLLECLGDCFGDVPRLAADKKRARKIRESGGCCPR